MTDANERRLAVFQLGSALLDACVLAVLQRSDTYGYLLTQNIRSVIDVSESTLYPVLRRLQKEQALTTYDSPYNGRNRRYYRITPQGCERLRILLGSWKEFKSAVDLLLAPAPKAQAAQAASGGRSAAAGTQQAAGAVAQQAAAPAAQAAQAASGGAGGGSTNGQVIGGQS
jgi:PadR family transcriptional regulator PadR